MAALLFMGFDHVMKIACTQTLTTSFINDYYLLLSES